MNYKAELLAAMERTRERGLDPGELASTPSGGVLREEHGAVLMDVLADLIQGTSLSPGHIAFQCAGISAAMKKHVSRAAGLSALLTIGTVILQGQRLWAASGDMSLTDLRDSGSFHVWLTLPTMQVVDFTLLMSLAVQTGRDPSTATPIATFPDSEPHIKWVPVFTGDDAYAQLLVAGAQL